MTAARRQRRDATANRERIVSVASEAFRRDGMSVDMRAIATAAGVGVGTLYRHFPTREHLVAAVTGTDLAALAAATLPVGATAIEGLRDFFTTHLTALADNRAMTDLLAAGGAPDVDLERCIAHLTQVGQDAVDRSYGDGTLAHDVTANDVAYQFLGLIRIAQLVPAREVLEHHIGLVLRGLSAD